MKSGGFWAVRAGLDRFENNPNKHLARLDMRCIFVKVADRRWLSGRFRVNVSPFRRGRKTACRLSRDLADGIISAERGLLENHQLQQGEYVTAWFFGDAFADALAVVRQLPLLFKGDDFIQTDCAAGVLDRWIEFGLGF